MKILNLLKNNINVISLIILLTALVLYDVGIAFFWILIYFNIFLIILAISDMFLNRDSSLLNFSALLILAFVFEHIAIEPKLLSSLVLGIKPFFSEIILRPFLPEFTLFLVILGILLCALFIFNYFKKNKIFRNSTKVILLFSLIFYCFVYPGTPYTPKLLNRVEICREFLDCKRYDIPKGYDDLKILRGSHCVVYRAQKGNDVIFINHLNVNIFPNAQSAEFIGTDYEEGILYFKVKQNNKYGFYTYDSKMCLEKESFTYTKRKNEILYNAVKEIMPPVYDDIQINKDKDAYVISSKYKTESNEYEVPFNDSPITVLVGKKGEVYDEYFKDRDSRDFELIRENKEEN